MTIEKLARHVHCTFLFSLDIEPNSIPYKNISSPCVHFKPVPAEFRYPRREPLLKNPPAVMIIAKENEKKHDRSSAVI